MIQALLPQIIPILGNVLDKAITNKDEKHKLLTGIESALVANAHNINIETIKTNQVEAGHRSIWVAGWRPAIGWSLAVGIFWMLVGQPTAHWLMALSGHHTSIPELPVDILFELTLAMLGMSAVRSFDKLKGLAK